MNGDCFLPTPYFSPNNSWNVFYSSLIIYFDACGINDAERQKVILLTGLDEQVYCVLSDLCHPTSPKNVTYDQLVALLRQHYVAPISVHRERLKFYASKQKRFETVYEWFVRMKSLSVDCRFGARLDAVLLDRFIIGLRSPVLLNRFCEETSADDERLTLAKAVELATHKECAIGVEKLILEEDVAAVPYINNNNNENNRYNKHYCY